VLVMASPRVTVSSSGDLSFLAKALKDLEGDQLLVGIPDKNTRRKQDIVGPLQKEPVTNAGLLYIHTNGSIKWKIPPRPVIEPAIQANRLTIEAMLMNAASERLAGNKGESTKWLKKCGTFAAKACKLWFEDPRNGWAQNTKKVIARKLRKLKNPKNWMTARHKEWLRAMQIVRLAPQRSTYGSSPLDGINTPLIDKGEMRRAITWIPNWKKFNP
jgi:hypothetical protein